MAAVIAVSIAVPNLVWDARNQWANLRMAEYLSQSQGGFAGAAAHLPVLLLLLAGPPLVVLWLAGVRRLGAAAEHRWVLAVVAVAVVLFTMGGGKSYYAVPVLLGLFAAGAVAVERAATPRGRVAWPLAIGVSGLVAAVFGLPVLPPGAASAVRSVDTQVVETYGWPGFVDQVAAAGASLPPDVPVFTSNYGEAGALTILGPTRGLHRAVYSAHNDYLLWGPPPRHSGHRAVRRRMETRLPASLLGASYGTGPDHHRRRSDRRGDRHPRGDLSVRPSVRQLGPALARPAPPRLNARTASRVRPISP